jgi:uncharacterized protein YbjT (DUF2867 family)
MTRPHEVFVTGGTGYIGRRVIPALLARGHGVRVLVRQGSESKVPRGCGVVHGDALDARSFAGEVAPSDTFLQLLGTPHPGPGKAREFRAVDFVSVRESAKAAAEAGIRHFVYVSVARPAPVMREYQAVRAEGEALIKAAGLTATFLRPWYVLGPGHRWPLLLVPFYRLAERLPATRDSARRLGLVTIDQFVRALVQTIENPPDDTRVVEVPEIRVT